MNDVLGSRTLRWWLILLAIALGVILFATAMQQAGVKVPYVSEFFNLLGVGGGAGTARNIVTDGIMPKLAEMRTLPPGVTPIGNSDDE